MANTLRSKKIPSLHAGGLPTDRIGEILVDEIRSLATAAG
jgi:hypothetical protein